MVTVVLFVLVIVLILAAGYVGLLILRRSRPTLPPGADNPQTVGELVRKRTAPPEDLSGSDLFTATEPRTGATAVPSPSDDPAPDTDGGRPAEVGAPRPADPSVSTPAGGVEAGDAPWRRAARMMGSEPGGGWETAPLPVVAESDVAAETSSSPAPSSAAPASVAPPSRAEGSGRTAVIAAPTPAGDAPTPDRSGSSSAEARVSTPSPADPSAPPNVSDAPSRPLSDPEMTPLMGIPIVRSAVPPVSAQPASVPPATVSAVPPPADSVPADSVQPDSAPEPAEAEPATPEPEPAAALVDDTVAVPATRSSAVYDDEVVWMQPATVPDQRPAAVTGSPQPVWFRVVRRDGEPVAGAVVSLLDDHGREADATKTATDGGGELHAPHSGRFLMITSAERFQPRAALLNVEEQPVEIALLLPRSARLGGVVRVDGTPLAGVRVIARQEGEVVDEVVTDRDGGYGFDDLAEGVYALLAAHARGGLLRTVSLSEGADVPLDLDLVPPHGAR